MKTSWGDALVTAVGVGCILYVLFLMFAAIIGDGVARHKQELAYQAKCEDLGGVVLDRTYPVGKGLAHEYTCAKKDAIIEVK